jgi:hypothetical protein
VSSLHDEVVVIVVVIVRHAFNVNVLAAAAAAALHDEFFGVLARARVRLWRLLLL